MLPGLGFLRHLLWAVYAVLRVVAGLVCRLYLQGRVQTFDEALICHRRILPLSERPNRFTLEYVLSVAEVDEDILPYRTGLRGIELPISHGSQVAMASVRQLSSHPSINSHSWSRHGLATLCVNHGFAGPSLADDVSHPVHPNLMRLG